MRAIGLVIIALCLFSTGTNARHHKKCNCNNESDSSTTSVGYFSRVVSIKDTTGLYGKKLRKEYIDTSLPELLFNKIDMGRAKAYKYSDSYKFIPMEQEQFSEIRMPKVDTVMEEDPVTGEIIKKAKTRYFAYQDVNAYRILERWKYNKKSGSTEIQIIGIAPLKEVWNTKHSIVIGKLPLFWMKYEDVKAEIERYEKGNVHIKLTDAIWDSYKD